MCLTNPTTIEPQVAISDITVYKTGFPTHDGGMLTYIRKYKYLPEIEPPKVEIGVRLSHLSDKPIVSEGYHSFENLDDAMEDCLQTEKAFKFKIPKGTKYFKGEVSISDGRLVTSIVSETIIMEKK